MNTEHPNATEALNNFYQSIDARMYGMPDRLRIAQCGHNFRYVSEMMLELFNAGFMPNAIGSFLDMCGEAVKVHLKRMGAVMRPSGGAHLSKSKTGVPGVAFNKRLNRHVAQLYIKSKRVFYKQCKTEFQAVVSRRQAETKHRYTGEPYAQNYIDARCGKLGCDLCIRYNLKELPGKCEGNARPDQLEPSNETFPEFLARAEKLVKENLDTVRDSL